jgi:hypothetical protein
MFHFTFGDVGNGKSIDQAETVLWLLERSVRIQKKYKLPLRPVFCNFHMAEWVYEKYPDRLFYWHNPFEMIAKSFNPDQTIKELRVCFDCVWDEMSVELPADGWQSLPKEIRAFFAQHRKRGIQIYGCTQDYLMVDKNARRHATKVFEIHKIFGSPDPDPTFPPVKHPWGVIAKWPLDRSAIRADDQNRIRTAWIPNFVFISKLLCECYNTSENIRPASYETQHIEYPACKKCGFKPKSKHLTT